MKTAKLTMLFAILLALFTFENVHAQWTDMEWETNNLKFQYPTDFTIKQNDASTFTASGSIFTMTIKAWEDYDYSDTYDICKAAVKEINCSDTILIEESSLDYQNGLIGYETYYTAKQNGKPMHMIIGGYQDDILGVDYSVQILYWDDPAQNDVNYKAAIYIMRSLGLIEE